MIDFRDLYFKCHQDRKDLQNSDPRTKPYAIFDLVVTLNHLFDWFLNDRDLGDVVKARCVKRFNSYPRIRKVPSEFRKYYGDDFPPINENQHLVREVCNKAKHWKVSPLTEALPAEVGIGAGSQYARVGAPWMRCGVSTNTIVTYLVEDEGKFYDMKLVCTKLHQEWGEFLRGEGLFVRVSS